MKLSKLKIPNFLKHKAGVAEGEHLVHPARDWHYLLFFFGLALLGSGALHYIVYVNLTAATIGAEEVAAPAKLLRNKDLAKITDRYRAQEAEFQALMAERP